MRSIKSGSDYLYTAAFKADDNTKATGLTPKLTMYKVSDSSVIINAQDMTEIANGAYKYTIPTANLVSGNSYLIYVDGGATLTTFRYQYDSIDVDKMPIGSELADAVCDEALSGHTTAGTVGDALSNLDAPVSLAGAGGGAIECTINSEKGGVSLADVRVYLTSDIGGTNVVTGTQISNSEGDTVWYLNPGTYYVWQFRAGETFSNPQPMTVVTE